MSLCSKKRKHRRFVRQLSQSSFRISRVKDNLVAKFASDDARVGRLLVGNHAYFVLVFKHMPFTDRNFFKLGRPHLAVVSGVINAD